MVTTISSLVGDTVDAHQNPDDVVVRDEAVRKRHSTLALFAWHFPSQTFPRASLE